MSDEQPTPDTAADGTRPDIARRWAASFGAVADAYDKGRPGYPIEAVDWLVPGEQQTVLELGAGTGKLTAALVERGHAVYATEPDQQMLEVLRERVPGCSAKQASAEEIPVNDRSVDVVVVAQAFHWFDHKLAMPEIARVLKPGGHLALVWNSFDTRIPWVRRLADILEEHRDVSATQDVLDGHELFGPVISKTFAHWQDITRETLVDSVASRSYISTLPPEARAQRLVAVRALYDEYGRGHDGMQLPHLTECFRAPVIDVESATDPATQGGAGEASEGPGPDTLLIDFR